MMNEHIEEIRKKYGEEELILTLSLAVRDEKRHEADELSAEGEDAMIQYLKDRLGPVGLIDKLNDWL